MEYKEWEKQRNAALEAFHEFVKTLPQKGFTVRQLEIIGTKSPITSVYHLNIFWSRKETE